MKIQKYEHVRYAHNPLAEVICQVRFSHAPALVESLPENLGQPLAKLGYTQFSEEQIFSVSIAFPGNEEGANSGTKMPTAKVFHLASATEAYKVSISADFVALTCAKYVSWEDFRPRFVAAYSLIRSVVYGAFPVRIGLRYKDLIERESLGLEGVAWHKLIAPFLLGPLSLNALSDDGDNSEDAIGAFVTQSTLQLDDCGLVLQGALLRSSADDRRAFLIDSDFFIENADPNAFKDDSDLISSLDVLHHNAGSLFRQGITKELHDALDPSPI